MQCQSAVKFGNIKDADELQSKFNYDGLDFTSRIAIVWFN
jgi:hypothetical protein